MQKRFLIPTVQDRIPDLKRFLLSMQKYKSRWTFTIVAQKYSNEEKMDLASFASVIGLSVDFVWIDDGIGPAMARRIGLDNYSPDVWISLDDDMLATPQTNFDRMAEIVCERLDIGLLSSNWAKTVELAESRGISEKFIKQPIVYTGGGLALRRDVAKVIVERVEDAPWLFDNVAWSLGTYCAGYENYRYLGSISAHRACAKGGRREWVYQKNRKLPDASLITTRPAHNNSRELEMGNCWHICDSRDLTEKAKALHKQGKERLGL